MKQVYYLVFAGVLTQGSIIFAAQDQQKDTIEVHIPVHREVEDFIPEILEKYWYADTWGQAIAYNNRMQSILGTAVVRQSIEKKVVRAWDEKRKGEMNRRDLVYIFAIIAGLILYFYRFIL